MREGWGGKGLYFDHCFVPAISSFVRGSLALLVPISPFVPVLSQVLYLVESANNAAQSPRPDLTPISPSPN